MIARRDLIVGAGLGLVGTLVGAPAALAGIGGGVLLLHDPALLPDMAGLVAGRGHERLALGGAADVATLLYRRYGAAPVGRPLFGVTSYADYVVASGIGRERGARLVGALLCQDEVARPIGGDPAALAVLAARTGLAPLIEPRTVQPMARGRIVWAMA